MSECRDECGSGDVCGYAGTECPLTCVSTHAVELKIAHINKNILYTILNLYCFTEEEFVWSWVYFGSRDTYWYVYRLSLP